MRIIKVLFVILFVTTIGLWWAAPAKAQCTGCQVCPDVSCVENPAGGQDICTDIWVTGPGCGQTNGGCPSGSYNTPSGMCKAIGGGSTGGGGGPEQQGGTNCPAGTVVDYNQPISTVCSSAEQGYVVGNAQRITGCCREVTIKGACEWVCEQKPKGEVCRKVCEPDEVRCAQNYYTTYACKSTCSAPSVPALTSPANGASLSATTVSLLWNSVTFSAGCTGQYSVYVGTANPPTTLYQTVDSNTTSTTYTGTRGTTYYWGVQAYNGSAGSGMNVRSFTILNDQIAGMVFYDAANNCGGSGWSTGGVSVSVDGGAGTAVSGTGTYSVTASPLSSHSLEVSIPVGYACSTASGCNSCSRTGISSPSANNNFYLTDRREPWWQAAISS